MSRLLSTFSLRSIAFGIICHDPSFLSKRTCEWGEKKEKCSHQATCMNREQIVSLHGDGG